MGSLRSAVGCVAVAAVAALLLAGCSTSSIPALPTAGIPDYQLGGAYRPASGVTIVERDSTAYPAAGKYNICYVNGFQTQGEDRESWLKTHPHDVLRNASGVPVHDPGWPDEMILDTSTSAKRASIASVVDKSVDRCASRHFDAVEFDNLDSFTRSDGALTAADDLALARLLVARAHHDGLAAGQKNAPDLARRGKALGYDFAIAEQCLRYEECSSYTKVYGKRVIDIEYTDDLRGSWASNCREAGRPALTILRDVDLVARGRNGYVFKHC